VIRASALRFAHPGGDFVLSVPVLEVGAGECVALVGPSGSGKSTLVHLLSGILQPSEGSIRIDDRDLTRMGEAARRRFRLMSVGLVLQDFGLVDYLDALENVLLPFRLGNGLPFTGETREQAAVLLRQLGVPSAKGRPVTRLSHGERQRVAVCRALLHQPRVLLADEPTASLDPANRDAILDAVVLHARQHGTATLVVTHGSEEIPRFDRVVRLGGGTLA
jgi:putative ABC transport system ATP-binding protein